MHDVNANIIHSKWVVTCSVVMQQPHDWTREASYNLLSFFSVVAWIKISFSNGAAKNKSKWHFICIISQCVAQHANHQYWCHVAVKQLTNYIEWRRVALLYTVHTKHNKVNSPPHTLSTTPEPHSPNRWPEVNKLDVIDYWLSPTHKANTKDLLNFDSRREKWNQVFRPEFR